jgi:hypothetical protein
MTAKVNATIEFKNTVSKYLVKLFDIDVIKDDEIASLEINKSEEIEFLFSLDETGEFNPELQLRIFDSNNKEVYRSEINNSISSTNIDKITGFMEVTTIDFGLITIL